MKRLDQAKAALEKKPTDALAHLVGAWAERPLPALAALVERFELVHPPPAFDGNTDTFLRAAKKPSVVELGSLARALVATKTADTIERLHALAAHRDDPRVASALLRLVHDVPWTSNGARPVWTKTFELLVRIADQRLLDVAKSLPAAWKFRENQREWMQRQLDLAVEAVSAARAKKPLVPLTAAEAKVVSALEAALVPATKPRASGTTREQLLAEVYANPDDDAPRLVLADWLLEREDPQGEFISLQFKPDATKAEKAREAALLKQHGAAWLGALASVTLKGVEFRRGFPAKAVARFKNRREAEQFGDAPEWATIDDLSWSLPGAASAEDGPWHQHLPKHARPKTMAVEHFTLSRMLEAKTPWPVERLTVSTNDVEVMRRFASSTLFPRVRSLTVNDAFAPQFLTSGWTKAVPELGYLTHNAPASRVLDALAARDSLVFTHTWAGTFRFSRGTDGTLSVLHLVTEKRYERIALGVLQELAGRVRVFTSEGVAKSVHDIYQGVLSTRPAPARPRVNTRQQKVVAAHPLDDGWAVLRGDAFVVTDATGTVRSELPINQTMVAAFSPDGALVGCGNGRRLEWRDGRTGALVATETLDDSLKALSFATDGRHALLKLEGRLEVRRWPERTVRWSARSGQYPAKPLCAALGTDGSTLFSAQYSEELRVSREGEKRATTVKAPAYSPGLAALPDGTFLLSSRDGLVRRLAADAPEAPLATWKAPESHLLLVSPDGTKALAGAAEVYAEGEPPRLIDLTGKSVKALDMPLKPLAWSKKSDAVLCFDGAGLVVRRV
jgi:uncharacterized protein (TIGR02996 family)